MASLPDDIWHKILQMGIETNRLDHTDLCSLAIVSNHFDQLSRDPALWDRLFSRDFPFSFYYFLQATSKDLYRLEYESEQCWLRITSFLRRQNEKILASLRDWPVRVPNNRNDRLSRYQSRIQDLQLQRTSNSRSLQSNISHSATQVSSGNQTNTANVDTVGGFGDVSSLFEEDDSANQPILIKPKKQYYENKPKRFDKSSKPKVIPSSKSYIPMNRPPRRSMPRKI